MQQGLVNDWLQCLMDSCELAFGLGWWIASGGGNSFGNLLVGHM